ncbi:NADPH:quinone oxidoreductase [Candidatus Nitrosoglobus terrae]|uniref:NADPH:quinone oxidoreductase n=2 Tax=Candidatus Nitrosoglobus terrae TaxID=1630141 RepID=A0A1Q2SMP9_9GAMM|nr:NADPH:quinone oxidoreductase [Candidatus Nitrosoglobus terrae]
MQNKTIFVQPGGGFNRVTIGQSEAAAPKRGEISVRLRATSLNFHDYAVVTGMPGFVYDMPRIPMADCAGEVMAVGESITEFAVGDSVISTFFPIWLDGEPNVHDFSTVPGDGIDGYAREQVTAAATSFTHAPKGWSHAEAATLPTSATTAWRALVQEGRIKAGDIVLVQGSGGLSTVALQLAKMLGATVVATVSNDAKAKRAKALGADFTVNYREDKSWGETVRKLTGDCGVDIVTDIAGPTTLEQSVHAVRTGGTIVMIGLIGGMEFTLPILPVLARQVQMKSIIVGSRKNQQDLVRAIDASGYRPVLDRHFNLDAIVEAFRYQESGQHFGKIILDI